MTRRRTPTVIAQRRRPNPDHPGGWLVWIDCPYCGRVHGHGWPAGWTTIGHRVSHCVDRGPHCRFGYFIELRPEWVNAA